MARSSDPVPADGRFFDRPTARVARDLLGAVVEVRTPSASRSVRLVEVEAYVARDPASHTYRGPTERNRSMYSAPGTVYVYRIHQVVCMNLVTRRGEAVLLRAGAPLHPTFGNPSGPGRLCRFLGVSLADDGQRVGGRRVAVCPFQPRVPAAEVVRTARVGISRATERPLRFSIDGDPWVSRPRPRAT